MEVHFVKHPYFDYGIFVQAGPHLICTCPEGIYIYEDTTIDELAKREQEQGFAEEPDHAVEIDCG